MEKFPEIPQNHRNDYNLNLLYPFQVFNLGLSIKNNFTQPNNTSYNIIRFPNGPGRFENATVLSEIPARWQFNPSYMHSFATTANYFVIIEQPLIISLVDSLKAKYLKRPLASIFKWFNDEFTYFYVVCRHTGVQAFTFKTSAFFYLHTINAYEQNDHLIVDICCYRDPSVFDCMYVEAMENMQTIANYANMFRSRPLRFVLPLGKQIHCKLPAVHSIWTRMKMFAYRSFSLSIDQYLRKYANTGVFIDSNRMKTEFWTMFEYEYDVKNLVNLANTQCRAYCTEDSIIYCVPERLCFLGCETPRINDRFGGKDYEFFYAISSDVDADNPGTVMFTDFPFSTIFFKGISYVLSIYFGFIVISDFLSFSLIISARDFSVFLTISCNSGL